jgi:23S rRNA (uracil1939-C5)-methyltransferase
MPGLDRIVYIACQPKSLLRDGHILEAKGYRLRHWELIDMFPNSTHIEAVAVFERA